MVNEVCRPVLSGLDDWRGLGAQVSLIAGRGRSIPRILLPSIKTYPMANSHRPQLALILTGQHLEETSGPVLVSRPETVLPILAPLLSAGIACELYPLINRHGLNFSATDDPVKLRLDESNRNYNSGWGLPKVGRPAEVALAEADIRSLQRFYKIILAATIHEDSTSPHHGYAWVNNFPDHSRRQLVSRFNHLWGKTHLYDFSGKAVIGDYPVTGRFEEFLMVDFSDGDSVENWLADLSGAPVICVESPYGEPLETRIDFGLAMLAAAIGTFVDRG